MSNSLNKTIIIGRLGMDPELRQGNKTQFTRFRLANTTFSNGQNEVQWHNICAFGKQAQICSKQLHKGDLCCIEGHLDNRSYEKNGEKRYMNSIVAENVTFLGTSRRSETPKNDTQNANAQTDAFLF